MSDIKIKINAGLTPETSSAQATGSLQHIITDEERTSFGIQDGDLKRKIGALSGKEPNDAYVRSPTPWDDLYKRYGWEQVHTVLTPIETKILSVDAVPTIISKQEFRNQSSKKTTVAGKISEQVSTTVGTSWSQTYALSFNQEITYSMGFLGSGGGGSTSFGFQAEWGKDNMESRTTTVGTEAAINVELDPGEAVVAELSANSGKMQVRVTYEARLTGLAAVNYDPKFEGHHFYGYDISAILGDSNSVRVTEVIDVGYYNEVRVTVKNLAGETLKSESF